MAVWLRRYYNKKRKTQATVHSQDSYILKEMRGCIKGIKVIIIENGKWTLNM